MSLNIICGALSALQTEAATRKSPIAYLSIITDYKPAEELICAARGRVFNVVWTPSALKASLQ